MADEQADDFATLTELAATEPEALRELAELAGHASPMVRAAALERYVPLGPPGWWLNAYSALGDSSMTVRRGVITGLGALRSDSAAVLLIRAMNQAPRDERLELLRAVGRTRSSRAIDVLTNALRTSEVETACAAADGIASFGGDTAIRVLRGYLDDENLDVREHVIGCWVGSLRQPLNSEWLVPVIRARKRTGEYGEARNLIRLHGGERAVPALVSCIDFRDPSTRGNYNDGLIDGQSWCPGAMCIPWVHESNRDGTPDEIAKNATTLRRLALWLDRRREYPAAPAIAEHPEVLPESFADYGARVDGVRVRLDVHQSVWPPEMPQMFRIRVVAEPVPMGLDLNRAPEVFQVELDGVWYGRGATKVEPTPGPARGGGSSFANLVLDPGWKMLRDGSALHIVPGKHTVRVRLSLKDVAQRTGLATSNAATFVSLTE